MIRASQVAASKDHVYFTGSLDVGRHLGQNPADRDLLLATKWPLAHIDTLRGLAAEGYVPRPRLAFDDVMAHAQSIGVDLSLPGIHERRMADEQRPHRRGEAMDVGRSGLRWCSSSRSTGTVPLLM